MRQFIRTNRPYQAFHNLLKDLFNEQVPPRFKHYEEIDWMRLGSHTVMMRLNELVSNLSIAEYDCIVTHRSAELSDFRIDELKSLFFFLAKLQADQELLQEIKGV